MNTSILDDSPAARGARLKKVRHLAGLSAEELAGKIGYSRQTISYWENATYSGLSHKGARKIIQVLKESGIYCEVGWLLYGVGNSTEWPLSRDLFSQSSWQVNENTKLLAQLTHAPIVQEIALFKQLYKNAVTLQLEGAIEPICEAGNWVGGDFEQIQPKLFGKLCIINFESRLQIKFLEQGKMADTVRLQSPYQGNKSNHSETEIKEIHLNEAAKVIRIWKQ